LVWFTFVVRSVVVDLRLRGYAFTGYGLVVTPFTHVAARSGCLQLPFTLHTLLLLRLPHVAFVGCYFCVTVGLRFDLRLPVPHGYRLVATHHALHALRLVPHPFGLRCGYVGCAALHRLRYALLRARSLHLVTHTRVPHTTFVWLPRSHGLVTLRCYTFVTFCYWLVYAVWFTTRYR